MSATSDLDFERGIVGLLPGEASTWGFRSGERGTHTSRTIMLDEITQLLAAVPGAASRKDYADAVTAGNCLGKKTAANRRISLQHLKELYGLEPRTILFRVFRDLWPRHESSRPLLALLLALARDPLLRAAAAAVLRTPCGHELSRQPMKDALSEATGDRLNQDTLDKAVRNAASSWTQSGHLRGRGRKSRQRVRATPAARGVRAAPRIRRRSKGAPAVRDPVGRGPGFRPRWIDRRCRRGQEARADGPQTVRAHD